MDYYSVLDLDKSASAEDIKSAYRRKAKEYHPDSGSGNASKFHEATEAYKVLSNPHLKKQYDTYGTANPRSDQKIDDIFESIFGFGFGGRQHSRRPKQGRGIKEAIEVTLEEAAKGIKKQIKNQYLTYCKYCSGQGGSLVTCHKCNGSGANTQRFGNATVQSPCHQCQGAGKTISQPCNKCMGSGEIYAYENLSIDIPPGVSTGTEFRIQGHGCEDDVGIPRGDLHLHIEVLPHKTFLRKNNDLVTEVEISMIDACLGASINLTSIYGEQINLKIPPGVQPGKTLKITNQGMPTSAGRGALYVVANIKIPEKISSKGKKILKELEKEFV